MFYLIFHQLMVKAASNNFYSLIYHKLTNMSIGDAQKNKNSVKVYVDFDGTISKSDIINFLLDKYADPVWLQLDKEYIEEKISSPECLTKQMALLKKLPNEKILESAKMVGIDETFKDFCRFCENKNICL